MLFVSLRSMRPCYLVLLVLVGLGVTGCNESNVNSPADVKKAAEGPQRGRQRSRCSSERGGKSPGLRGKTLTTLLEKEKLTTIG